MAPNPFRVAKRTPWMLVIQGAMIANEHWKGVPTADRQRLKVLVTKSKGKPGNLTAQERRDVRRIVGSLDAPGASRKLLPLAGKKRRGRR